MKVSAKADYALRAAIEIASHQPQDVVKAETIAMQQKIPAQFLSTILNDLRRGGIVRSRRGQDGGYFLATTPDHITVADVLRAIDGPIVSVAGVPPEDVLYRHECKSLQDTWFAARGAVRHVLEGVTLQDIAQGDLPPTIAHLAAAHHRTR